ncbi:DUF1376 domain-containing protein [Polaromonas sp. 17-63-33]|jgi:uncharacterized protein YdaU (DUF1376 family)|nr:DUF1376 domain-containing protein [Polaromonas sp. 17-63-33]HQS00773.1 DUF1376 domain-containing protein [Polaromonas sp.]
MHIGDYAEATGHLSPLEDGMYWRMLRKYYATERPLPAQVEKIQRLVAAKTPEEIAAVDAVLADFFKLEPDGWHQDRCDEVIAAYKAGEPDRVAKKVNEQTRSDRHRLERRRLFEALNAVGKHATWNIGIKELRDLVLANCGPEALQNAANHAPEATPATAKASQAGKESPSEATAPVTAPATPVTATATLVTATQSPVPTTHNPLPSNLNTPLPPKGGKRVRAPKPDAEDPPGFVEWYTEYRRKDARKDAVKAWAALAPDEALQARMLAALRRWPWKTDNSFNPLPASWIRGERWTDIAVADARAEVPDWCRAAGFDNTDEAANFGCYAHTADQFRDRRRVEKTAEVAH